MNTDLQSLSTDTLLYMLMHSGFFVLVMGLVFFSIGLAFGWATWGRYKHQAHSLAAELHAQREEIATLKRKLGEQTVRPGGAVMVTEVLSRSNELPTPAEPTPPSTEESAAKPIRSKNVIQITSASLAAREAALSHNTEAAPSSDGAPPVTTPPADAPLIPSPLAAIISPQPPPKKDSPPLSSGLGAAELGISALPEVPPASAVIITPEEDSKLGTVFKTPPPLEQRDDLTAMKGIAKVLEGRLHEFGIYTYAQIAAWDETRIREFSSRLAFKDRILREDWVGQAKRLLAEKHGAPASEHSA